MSDLSYLETLSNKELFAKCREYDLPSIPVTDTSRNVILRRLRATILGQPRKNAVTAAKKTPRRETIHSSKPTPTASATTSALRIQGKSPSRSNNNNNRRTIAGTSREHYSSNISPIRSVETTTTVSDVGSHSEDDDDFYLIESPQSRKQQTHNHSRRRSVSLSKSGVLTTSYTREVQSPSADTEEEPQSYTYKRPETVPSGPSHTLPIYEPRIEPNYRPELSRQNLTHTQLNSTSYSQAPNYYDEAPIQQPQRNTFNGSRAPFALTGSATSPTRSFGENGFARGRLSQPTYNSKSLYPRLNEFYDQQNNRPDPMEVDSDTETEPETEIPQHQRQYHHQPNDKLNSPYVSGGFSKQIDLRQRSSPLSRPQMHSINRQPNPEAPIQKFNAMLISLNQQYHLNFYLFLLLTVMIATFIYVIVTPAV